MPIKLILVLDSYSNRYDGKRGNDPLRNYMSEDTRWDDWAKNAKGMIDKKREAQRLADQTLVTTQNLLEKKAPTIWATIRAEIQAMRKALNAQADEDVLVSDSVKANETIIRIAATGDKSTAKFIPETSTIAFDGLRTNEIFTASVVNGDVVFLLGRSPQQPHEIAKRFMDSVVAGIS